jgi:hypothetical protein
LFETEDLLSEGNEVHKKSHSENMIPENVHQTKEK